MLLTTFVLLLTAAPPSARPQVARPEPITVQVEVAPSATAAAAQTWAKELRSDLEARKDEFRLVAPGQRSQLVVRVESVVPGPGGTNVMNGAIVQGKNVRTFALQYAGEVRPMAQKLARDLRKIAASKSPPPAPKK